MFFHSRMKYLCRAARHLETTALSTKLGKTFYFYFCLLIVVHCILNDPFKVDWHVFHLKNFVDILQPFLLCGQAEIFILYNQIYRIKRAYVVMAKTLCIEDKGNVGKKFISDLICWHITFWGKPAGTQHQNDVVSTSMRRDHVASSLIRRQFNVVCQLGSMIIIGLNLSNLMTFKDFETLSWASPTWIFNEVLDTLHYWVKISFWQ